MNTESYFKMLDFESLKIIKTRLLLCNSQWCVFVSLKPSIQTLRPSTPYATAQDGSVQIYSYFILQSVYNLELCVVLQRKNGIPSCIL
jgi:hypothetical protein